MRHATWYFDFLSPYAYLQLKQMDQLPRDVAVTFQPVLFAGLLNHWGQLGPVEIPGKKVHTMLVTHWRAQSKGIAFRPPPRVPFNPLAVLRLAIALGASRETVTQIFDHIWAEGHDGQDEGSLDGLAEKLGVADWRGETARAAVKAQLRTNTEAAIAAGVFGVPTFVIEGQMFWGDDSFELMCDWLADPGVLDNDEVRRLLALDAGAERKRG